MLARNPRGPIARIIMVIAAAGLFVVGYHWGNRYKYGGGPPVIQGVLLRPPVELPGFELKETGGIRFTLEELKDHWTLLAFSDLRRAGSHLAVNRMIGVYNRLADKTDLQVRLQLALAAEEQDLELARDFSRLSPALKVLSGEADELKRLRASVGDLPPEGSAPPEEDGAPLYLIDPKARLMALFPHAEGSETIAADLSALADRPDLLEPIANE
jgi:hypothetical protein